MSGFVFWNIFSPKKMLTDVETTN